MKILDEDQERVNELTQFMVGEPDADPGDVPESVIHEIWRLQQFRLDDLHSVDGRRIVVLDAGRLNADQGPDFLDARIVIGDTTWAGSVEIHRASAEWRRHGHESDPLYHGVILHVALVADRYTGRLSRGDGSLIPEIVLYPRLKDSLRKLQWQFRRGGRLFFACQDQWMHVPDPILAPFLRDLAMDRLRRKRSRLEERFLQTPDMDQILYEEIFRSLGYIQNSEAMVLLARRVPFRLLQSISDPRDAVALLLGCAGLLHESALPEIADDFEERFDHMVENGAPEVLPKTIWRNARLRPANSPRRRIMQAAVLLGQWGGFRSPLIDVTSELLTASNPGRWLSDHLEPAKDVAAYVAAGSPKSDLALGQERRVTIAANALLPSLLLHTEQTEATESESHALSVLEKLPVVMDHIVRRYSEARGRPASACVAQGLHELSRTWCGAGKCRDCVVWRHIASPG